MKCECGCGNDAQIGWVERGSDEKLYCLCHNCVIPFANLSLKKKQYLALLKAGHTADEFMIHSDFYDSDGTALQPMLNNPATAIPKASTNGTEPPKKRC